MKLNDLIQRVRAQPGLPSHVTALGDDDFAFAVAQNAISVLQDMSERIGRAFGAKRHLTLTDPTATTITLEADGTADLTALMASSGLLLELLQYGEIRHPDSPFPFVPCGSSGEGALPGNFDSQFLHYWLVGRRIHTRSADSNNAPLSGDLSFACSRTWGLDTLPPQLDDELTEGVTMRMKGSSQIAQPKPAPAGSPE